MKAVAILAAVLLGLAALAFGVLFGLQRRFIYPAPAEAAAVSAPGFERVELLTTDGLLLSALYRPAQPQQPTIIFFHGNGDSLSGSVLATAGLAKAGYGLLLPEYRGYGGNQGSPDEAGLYLDAAAAAAFLRQRGIPDSATVAYGNSLGSGPATQLAMERPLAALVIVSGFLSLPDVVATKFGPLPIRPLVRDSFDNFAKLGRSKLPILVVHGDADMVIPVTQGQRLGTSRPGITYREVEGFGHELAYQPEAQDVIMSWLGSLSRDR